MKELYIISLDEEFQKARKLGAKDIKKRKCKSTTKDKAKAVAKFDDAAYHRSLKRPNYKRDYYRGIESMFGVDHG